MKDYLDDAVDDYHVLASSDILYSSESAADDTYQRDYGISQFWAVVVQQIQQKIELLCFLYFE